MRSAMLLKMTVRPYLASDKLFAQTLYGLISGSFKAFGLELGYFDEEIQAFTYETLLELFEKHPATVVVGHQLIRDALSIATTPGLGSEKNMSVIVSSLEGQYTPPDLVGVVWHEIGENIFHLSHHPLQSKAPCAMGDVVSKAEISQALFSSHHDKFSKEVLERYKKLPPVFCQKCIKRVQIIQTK